MMHQWLRRSGWRRGLKWCAPPLAVVAGIVVLVMVLGSQNHAQFVDLREDGVLVSRVPRQSAAQRTSERLGFSVLVPNKLAGLNLEYVDSISLPTQGTKPYAEIGYAATDSGEALRTLRIWETGEFTALPIEKSIEVRVDFEGMGVWRPPSPFGEPGGTLNFQFIVRLNGRQYVLWYAQASEPSSNELHSTLEALVVGSRSSDE